MMDSAIKLGPKFKTSKGKKGYKAQTRSSKLTALKDWFRCFASKPKLTKILGIWKYGLNPTLAGTNSPLFQGFYLSQEQKLHPPSVNCSSKFSSLSTTLFSPTKTLVDLYKRSARPTIRLETTGKVK